MKPPQSQRVRCRAATEADTAFRQQLFASTRGAELAALTHVPQRATAFGAQQFDARERAYRAAAPQSQCCIVEAEGAAVGQIWLDTTAQALRLLDISLLPAHRGAGLGEQLLRDLMCRAQALQLPLELQVAFDNPARRLYARLGFIDGPDDGAYQTLRWPALAQAADTEHEEIQHAQT